MYVGRFKCMRRCVCAQVCVFVYVDVSIFWHHYLRQMSSYVIANINTAASLYCIQMSS